MGGRPILFEDGPEVTTGSGRNRRDWIMVALLTALGLGLRLAYLLRVPPFLDEYSSMLTGMSILRTGGLPELPSGVLYPSGSLFSYVEAMFLGLFGFSDFIARLPSLLLAGLTLPLLYLVARRLLGRRVALLSVAMLAVAPEAIVWGGRARMYALLQLLVLLTSYFFYRGVLEHREGGTPEGRRQWLWVACFSAAIFAQDEAILLLPIFWLAAVLARGPRWLLQPRVLLIQVGVPLAGVFARYWLNRVRVPGEVYTLVHDAFFRFPPALSHGLGEIAPFFAGPGAWLPSLFFAIALGLLGLDLLVHRRHRQEPSVSPDVAGANGRLPALFFAYVVLATAAAIVLVVNTPWQDDRYLFMVLPLFLMVAARGMEQTLLLLAQRLPALSGQWATLALVVGVTAAGLPAGISTLDRYEPDYSSAYRWLQSQLGDDDLIATVRPAPAAVYLDRSDFLVAEDKHREFVMRINGVWVDRWTAAKVLESPQAFRDEALESGKRLWFIIDEDRFESARYSPELVGMIVEQMDLVWHQGGVLIFQGQGYHPGPEMEVTRALDANFEDQVRLTGYALSSDQPRPGQEVIVQLFWEAIRPERNYTVFIHVVGTDGKGVTQVDGEPFLGLYGMSTHWPRDRAVLDQRAFSLPEDTAPGRYRLEVGLYDAAGEDSSALRLPDGATNLVLDYLKVGIVPPPQPSEAVSQGTLGGVVELEGYDPSLPDWVPIGSSLPLTLTWRCLDTMEENYTVFVHLAGADGQPVSQADGQPAGGSYPTRFWDVGERVADPRVLDIPEAVPPGEYELRVGMYLLATGDRLPAEGGGDSILLADVRIEAP